jgi:type I restriction enzyme, S subunit
VIAVAEKCCKTVPLGEVAEFIRGITFTPNDKVDPHSADSVVCMRTANIQADLDESDLIAVPKEFVRRFEQFLHEGDLLVSTANSWNLVGKCVWVPKLPYSATAGGFISILRGDARRIDQRYLFHWFSSDAIQHEARRCGRQTTNISNLDYGRCLALAIPLPPLAEQNRIAAILDKADALRRKRREVVASVTTLLDSIFGEMFGSVAARRSPYEFQSLRPYLAAASGKSSKDVLSSKATSIPIYGGNGQNGWATQALYNEPVVVVGRVGQQCGITRMTEGPAWITDNAIVVEVVDHSKVHAEYLEAALQRSPLRSTVEYIDLPFINQSIILDQPLPLPPIETQLEYVRRKAGQAKLLRAAQTAASRADDLFSSLVQRAFRGEL